MAEILDSWAQVEGGVRYAVRVGRHVVTVDELQGKRTGFVHSTVEGKRVWINSAHQNSVISRAFRCVRAAPQH